MRKCLLSGHALSVRLCAEPSPANRKVVRVATVTDAYIRHAGEAECRWTNDTFVYFLATGESTGGAFALVDETAPQGESVPLHVHADDVESFYVLDGEVSFFVGDASPVRAGRGAFVHVPGGVVHGFRIESETARYLILTTARHGDFYREISHPAGPAGEPSPDRVDGDQIARACQAYGIEFVRPLPHSE